MRATWTVARVRTKQRSISGPVLGAWPPDKFASRDIKYGAEITSRRKGFGGRAANAVASYVKGHSWCAVRISRGQLSFLDWRL